MTDEAKNWNKDALREQYEDALFRLALIEIEEERVAKLQREIDEGRSGIAEEEYEAFYRRSLPRVERTMDRAFRKRRWQRFARQTLPKAGQIAAAALLVFFIGGSVAVAAVRPVRAQLMKLLIHIEREYTELSLVPDENAYVDVPEGWIGDYFPAYVPEGFELVEESIDDRVSSIQYKTEDDRWLDFGEYNQDTGMNIDTEDAEIRYLEVGGAQALISVKNGYVTVVWAYADRYFLVGLEGSPSEALRIARSVQKIK